MRACRNGPKSNEKWSYGESRSSGLDSLGIKDSQNKFSYYRVLIGTGDICDEASFLSNKKSAVYKSVEIDPTKCPIFGKLNFFSR